MAEKQALPVGCQPHTMLLGNKSILNYIGALKKICLMFIEFDRLQLFFLFEPEIRKCIYLIQVTLVEGMCTQHTNCTEQFSQLNLPSEPHP